MILLTQIIFLLGKENDTINYYSIETIMKKLNHKHVDIFKIDIEGHEWEALFEMDKINGFNWVGQIIMELHVWINAEFIPQKFRNGNNFTMAKRMVDLMEKHNLRMFHKEINYYSQAVSEECAEFSFIQKCFDPSKTNKIYNENDNCHTIFI